MRTTRFLLAALLLAPHTLTGQQRHHSVHVDDGRRVEVEILGQVRFTDDDRGVRSLSPGGRLVVEENGRGLTTRRLEYRAGSAGAVERLYLENGRRREPDAEAVRWMESALLTAIRRSGIGAEERVARIFARGGTAAVLREIEQIRGDGAQTRYFRTLLSSHRMGAADLARVLRLTAEEIDSDGDQAHLLSWVAANLELDRDPVRAAYFQAVGTIDSDGDRHHVLASLLRRGRLSEPTLVALLRSAAGIGSDGDRAGVLARAAEGQSLAVPEARSAFFRAVGGIGSDGDRAVVLSRVLRHHADREVVLEVVRSAAEIGSDGDKALVLLQVPAGVLRQDAVAQAYATTMKTIGSDGDRSRVALHLLAARRS